MPGLVTLTGRRKAGQAWAVVRRVHVNFEAGTVLVPVHQVVTADGSGAAHWEYTAAVTEDGPRILTVWAAGFACELKRRLIGVSIGGSVMTDPEAAVAGRATRPTHVAGRAGRSSHVAGRATRDAAVMRVLYDEHAAALWRYAMRLTGDRSRAEDVVQETLLRAWQHPEVVDDSERSARAWLFTVARNMIIDERRSSRFRNEVATLDTAGTVERAGARRGQRGAGPAADRRRDGTAVRGAPRGDPPVLLSGLVDVPDC